MPGTFTDEKCAVVLARQQGAHRNRIRLKNSYPITRLLTITALAAIASVSLTGRVAKASLYWDYSSAFPDCRGTSQKACRQDAFVGSSPAEFHGKNTIDIYGNRRKVSNDGDYLDREWYDYLDKGQYYYLDIGQYKLLGGLSYRLGHPCYPRLFERPSGWAEGFTNKFITGWLGQYRGCRISWLRNEPKTMLSGVYGPGSVPMLIYDYDIWGCCFNAGDYIDKWSYYYLDLGRYNLLDRGQYKWLGGLAYLFETTYDRSSCILDPIRLQRNFFHNGPAGDCAIPEPATIAILGVGAVGVLVLGKKRTAGKNQE